MLNESTGERYDYGRKDEVVACDIELPPETPSWLRRAIDGRDANGASEALWNAVEKFEKRSDSQLANEIEFALPIELTQSQNIELLKEFATTFTDRGMVVDWSYHDAPGNPHVHMMLTLRPLTEEGFGPKRVPILGEDGQPIKVSTKGGDRYQYRHWSGNREDLREWRGIWAETANRKLAECGHAVRIDHRSHKDAEIDLLPSRHKGQARTHAAPSPEDDFYHNEARREAKNTQRLLKNPELILADVTTRKSVFEMSDVTDAIAKYISNETTQKLVLHGLRNSNNLVRLQNVITDPKTKDVIAPAKYSTPDMILLERRMQTDAAELFQSGGHGVKRSHLKSALAQYDFLSQEQRMAVRFVTGSRGLSNLVGLAGAGKTTLLKASNTALERSGKRVIGLALAGKAAESLTNESGIASRTLASFEHAMKNGRETLSADDVVVLDEAGMVGSRQMAWLLAEVNKAGAKAIFAGDPDQLPAIEAGCAFQSIIDGTAAAEVTVIRRQSDGADRLASLNMARGSVKDAIEHYIAKGQTYAASSKNISMRQISANVFAEIMSGKDSLAVAQSNTDVDKLNLAIRSRLVDSGMLEPGITLSTSRGEANFATGDKLVFLKNDYTFHVKNGTTGTVTHVSNNSMTVRLADGRTVRFDPRRYDHFTHGYAVTIHKSQGATVDSVHMLATRMMRRNQAYVAMTRHRDRLNMYWSKASFNVFEGGLVEALSRPDDKTTTLDYADSPEYARIIEFGSRRGFDTRAVYRQSQQLKDASARLTKIFEYRERLNDLSTRADAAISQKLLASNSALAATKQPLSKLENMSTEALAWIEEQKRPKWLIEPATEYSSSPEDVAKHLMTSGQIDETAAIFKNVRELRTHLSYNFPKPGSVIVRLLNDVYDVPAGERDAFAEERIRVLFKNSKRFGEYKKPRNYKPTLSLSTEMTEADHIHYSREMKRLIRVAVRTAGQEYDRIVSEERKFRELVANGVPYPSSNLEKFMTGGANFNADQDDQIANARDQATGTLESDKDLSDEFDYFTDIWKQASKIANSRSVSPEIRKMISAITTMLNTMESVLKTLSHITYAAPAIERTFREELWEQEEVEETLSVSPGLSM
jgi:Ti-type conjugative transfer relaxase TraA